MENSKYIIISELDRLGYVFGIMDNLENAKSVVDKLFDDSRLAPFEETWSKLKYKAIASYSINGNEIHNIKSEYGHFGGSFNIAVIKIGSNINCLRTFIKERENYSWVFEFDDYGDEFERLAELFPSLDIGAN
jgi:hypothetical protein